MNETDVIRISGSTATAVSNALDQDVYTCETPERMAWIVLLLRKLDDTVERFPRGKWATIQHIEQQLDRCADAAAIALSQRPPVAGSERGTGEAPRYHGDCPIEDF